MDTMDNVANATAANRFTGFYLDFSQHLAKVRVAGSNPVVRSIKARSIASSDLDLGSHDDGALGREGESAARVGGVVGE